MIEAKKGERKGRKELKSNYYDKFSSFFQIIVCHSEIFPESAVQ